MMNIALGFDSNYAPYAAVTIKSILLHNKNITFYILYDKGLKKSDIKKIDKLIKTGENCSVEWVELTGYFEKFDAGSWKSSSVYFPVALPEICKDDKILFLDSDILVRGSLENLYNQNLDGYYLAAATDIGMIGNFDKNCELKGKSFNNTVCAQEYFKKVFNYTKTEDITNYINTGTILLNLKAMREDNIVPKFKNALEQINFAYNDQCCFNYVCKGKIKLFPENIVLYIIKPHLVKRLPENIRQNYIKTYNESSNPLIIHFLKKPWLEPEGYMPYKKEFYEVKKQTPYRYHLHPKEICKWRFSKKGKYLYLFRKKIYDTRKAEIL